MAVDLEVLQTELETAVQTYKDLQDSQFQAKRVAEEEARLAAEAAKTDEDKAAEIQAQIDAVNAEIARLQA
jgi:hypothetical protein